MPPATCQARGMFWQPFACRTSLQTDSKKPHKCAIPLDGASLWTRASQDHSTELCAKQEAVIVGPRLQRQARRAQL